MTRFLLAIKCFFAILFGRPLPVEAGAPPSLNPAPAPAPVATTTPSTTATFGAVQMIALMQREGRLLDFLQEPIDGYGDAQIGAAVRDIHKGCRKVLAEHFTIEPVMSEAENARVRIDGGFDAAAIRLVGNVVGQPPFEGVLRHHGWRTTRVDLPQLPALAQPAILAPAEVELS